MTHQVEDFARRQPAAFLGGAFAIGFLAARFLKSGGGGGYAQSGTYSSGYQSGSEGSYYSGAPTGMESVYSGGMTSGSTGGGSMGSSGMTTGGSTMGGYGGSAGGYSSSMEDTDEAMDTDEASTGYSS
jgi:hypothetical protein